MHIYIDESGSFVESSTPGAWNTVVAYVVPERDERRVAVALSELKRSFNSSGRLVERLEEIKLRELSEEAYFGFLLELTRTKSVAFCVATDAHDNAHSDVASHQELHVKSMRDSALKMAYPEGRRALEALADKVDRLSSQLYVQMVCQTALIFEVLDRSILYYSQHRPQTLHRFSWRIDQKNSTRTDYERAFEIVTLPVLQRKWLDSPILLLKGADYTAMQRFAFKEGEYPDYLQNEHGYPYFDGFNLQKMLREDMIFVDSKHLDGVQIADLLAAGFRRLLRRGFRSNYTAAKLLGKLMIQASHAPSLQLLTLGSERKVDLETARLIHLADAHCRRIIRR